VLDNFARADQNQIRNKSGFLMGIIRRFKERQAAFGGTGATPGGGATAPSQQCTVPWPRVQAQLDALLATGKLAAGDLQARVYKIANIAYSRVPKYGDAQVSGG